MNFYTGSIYATDCNSVNSFRRGRVMETVAKTPKYNLNDEQERKLILREYRSLMRSLKSKDKTGR
jgi:hypothetical protein